MKEIKIKRGLRLPFGKVCDFKGEKLSREIGFVGDDFTGLKVKFLVNEGDKVSTGSPLFINRKDEDVVFVSPVNGVVKNIVRGEKRKFLYLSIEVENHASGEAIDFEDKNLNYKDILLKYGFWPYFRKRPFDKIPSSKSKPVAIFITAIDTRGFAPDPNLIIEKEKENFIKGVDVLKEAFGVKTFLCVDKDFNKSMLSEDNLLEVAVFHGPHPAGLAGTHIDYLRKPTMEEEVWYIDYQAVIDIGYFFNTGKINPYKYVSIAGYGFKENGIFKILKGSRFDDILNLSKDYRYISGCYLYGRKIDENAPFIGFYDNQVSIIKEGGEKRLFGWISPSGKYFTVLGVALSKFIKPKKYIFDTSMHGSLRPIIPISSYNKVTAIDTEPLALLRAVLTKDIDRAIDLGILSLGEEDFSLYTYVCPSKIDFIKHSRELLDTIEKEW